MTRLLLVGCGKMGGAMLSGWLDQGIAPENIVVAEPAPPPLRPGVRIVADSTLAPASFEPEIVVLAVKPQSMDKVLPALARYAQSACYLSIAAGRTLASLESGLGVPAAIVRVMPNLPASVGHGLSIAVPNGRTSDAQRTQCDALIKAVGAVEWIDDESLMDAVTAVSGSGPAYVFLLVETLAKAGIEAGLPADLAQRMARATIVGSGALLAGSTQSAAQLREAVTSPGGTTFAALQVLMAKPGMAELMQRAVAAARRRSRELA